MGSQSYKLTARFANALNLPAKAKVRLGGADVGEVESMDAVDYVAVVQLRIREGVRLPVGTTAQLRTATPLGDVFVAVTPPATPVASSSRTAARWIWTTPLRSRRLRVCSPPPPCSSTVVSSAT